MTWFGSLDLAWKYTLVFGILLGITIIAGFIKVLYNKYRLKKFTREKADLEAGRTEEIQEINQREKDEGDLFGIRAIEAGFYAGIPQSRPTSSAGVTLAGTPSMSTNTLVGSLSSPSPKLQSHSVSSSITSLPPAHLKSREASTDSDILGLSIQKPRRKTPPALKLQPSEAELNGRLNHNASVNMTLAVSPSPNTLPVPPKSPAISIHDYDAPDSPPRSPGQKPDHYMPSAPPQLPMPEGLRASIFSTKSQTPSFYIPSSGGSPNHSAPTSPMSTAFPPQSRVPSMAPSALGDEPKSPRTPGSPYFPVYYSQTHGDKDGELDEEPYRNDAGAQPRPTSPVKLLPLTYTPTHGREASESSVYSERRWTYQRNRSASTDSNTSLNYSLPHYTSQSTSAPTKEQRRLSTSSYLQAPASASSNAESRLSDFYDAYYRQSTLVVAQKGDGKRPNQLSLAPPTIVEVPTPVGSPMPPQSPAESSRGVAL